MNLMKERRYVLLGFVLREDPSQCRSPFFFIHGICIYLPSSVLAPSSDALVPSSFLLLVVAYWLLVAYIQIDSGRLQTD